MRTPRVSTKTAATAATTLLALSLLAACGDTGSDSSPPAPSAATEASDAEGGPHNDADVEFAQAMIPHHAQAVAMAQMAEARARTEEVRRLAAEIEAAQGPEIEQMAGWLESWGEDVPASTGTDHGAMGHDMDDMNAGTGMMSADDLMSLEGSSGRGFDRMFLTMMIEHHEGAIVMARAEQRDGEFPEAVSLAEAIEDAQTTEIATMRGLLGS